MPVSTSATRFLDLQAIPYHLFEHLHPPGSLEQAAAERGQVPAQIIRSILFRYEKDKFFLTLVAGAGRISWKKLRSHLGVSRISLATEQEVLTITGYSVGTVCPFGLQYPVRILADESVFIPKEISLGSGQRGVAIIVKSSDLKRAVPNTEIGSFL